MTTAMIFLNKPVQHILKNLWELAGASLRSAPLVAWWKNLLPISLYVVLGAGRKQFGILEGFRLAECVPPRHWSFSGRQSVFRHTPGQFLVGWVCSASSHVNFRSAKGVPLRPGLIYSWQSPVLEQYPVSRVCSVSFRVNFRSAECVPPCLRSISSRQRMFRHIPVQFPDGRVCSATSRVYFRSAKQASRPRWILLWITNDRVWFDMSASNVGLQKK